MVINKSFNKKAAWPSGQRVGLAIRRSQVRVLLWRIAGVALSCLEFKSSPTLVHVNSQVAASCQLGFLILLCCIWIIICFYKYLSAVPVNQLDKLSALSTINKPLSHFLKTFYITIVNKMSLPEENPSSSDLWIGYGIWKSKKLNTLL